jgi:hypothetical protein
MPRFWLSGARVGLIGRAADRISRAALREGTRIADYLTGLDKRPGGRGGNGGGFVAGAAGRAVSSGRKTTRVVITRTIIDGTTDMRESPDWIVLSMQISDGCRAPTFSTNRPLLVIQNPD